MKIFGYALVMVFFSFAMCSKIIGLVTELSVGTGLTKEFLNTFINTLSSIKRLGLPDMSAPLKIFPLSGTIVFTKAVFEFSLSPKVFSPADLIFTSNKANGTPTPPEQKQLTSNQ